MTRGRRSSGDLYRPLSEVADLLKEGARLRAERMRAIDMITVEGAATVLNVEPLEISKGVAEGRCVGNAGIHRNAFRGARRRISENGFGTRRDVPL